MKVPPAIDEASREYSEDKLYSLYIMLDTTRNAMIRARRKELRKYHLENRQAAVLYFSFEANGKITPSKIAKWLVLEPHSISELVSRMEKKGLVKIIKHDDSHYYERIKLTKKGLDACVNVKKRESIHKIMSCLTDEERDQLKSILIKIKAKALEES